MLPCSQRILLSYEQPGPTSDSKFFSLFFAQATVSLGIYISLIYYVRNSYKSGNTGFSKTFLPVFMTTHRIEFKQRGGDFLLGVSAKKL